MPSPEHERYVAAMRGGLGFEGLPVDEQRKAMEATAGMFPVEPDVAISEVDVDGLAANWIDTDVSQHDRVILYFHGGGYVLGSRNTHRELASRIARAANARALLLEYRLAPEHPFPAAVEDTTACWRWLLAEGYAPENMAIAGDSAGGGLALSALLALKAVDLPMPACAVALSPWTDLEGSGPTARTGVVDDPILTVDGVRESGKLYAGGHVRNPLASPLFGDLNGLPPLLLQVGTREILLSDSTRFAEKARAAGVEVRLEVEEGLVHVWQMLPSLPEAQTATDRIGKFVTRCFRA